MSAQITDLGTISAGNTGATVERYHAQKGPTSVLVTGATANGVAALEFSADGTNWVPHQELVHETLDAANGVTRIVNVTIPAGVDGMIQFNFAWKYVRARVFGSTGQATFTMVDITG